MIKDPAIKKALVRQCYEKKISKSALAKELQIPRAKIRQLIESYGYILEPPKKIKKYVLKNVFFKLNMYICRVVQNKIII